MAARAYLAILRVGVSAALMYRANFLFTAGLTLLVGIGVQSFLWTAVYSGQSSRSIAGIPFEQMLLYVVCATLSLSLTRSGRIERMVAEEIRLGELSRYLLKPVGHAGYAIAMAAAERMVTLPVVLGLAAVAMSSILPVPLAKVAEMLLAALPLLLLGMLVNFLLGLGISYLAFWMDEVWTLHVVKDISLWFLSGQLLPLSLLPSTAAQISALLPFQHLAYTPAGIMAELIPVSALPGLLAHALLWCGLLSCAVAALWRAGIRRYGAYGG